MTADAVRAFVGRVAPFDHPDAPVVTTVVVDGAEFGLTARTARAFAEALHRYADPEDRGRCPDCGGVLDRDLRCVSCGRVDGIFGATVADWIALDRDSDQGVRDRPSD